MNHNIEIKPNEVWVFCHEHKHDDDMSVFTSKEKAEAYALSVVSDNREEFDIPRDVTDLEAFRNWHEYSNEKEFMGIRIAELDKEIFVEDKQ